MKTEERHELHDNLLAKWLGEILANSQSYLTLVAGLLILVGAVWFGKSALDSRAQARREMGWSDVFQAQQASDLENVATAYQGTLAGAWALQRAADEHLSRGALELFRDFKKATEQFELARDGYEKVLSGTDNPMLLERAQFGLAQCFESLQKFDEAKKHYATVVERWPDGALAKLATDRQLLLSRPGTTEFFDWYFKQTPPLSEAAQAASRAAAGSGVPASTPLDTTLPTQPDIQLPSALDSPSSGSTPPGEPSSPATPPAGSETP